jgi:hypothetical protein
MAPEKDKLTNRHDPYISGDCFDSVQVSLEFIIHGRKRTFRPSLPWHIPNRPSPVEPL